MASYARQPTWELLAMTEGEPVSEAERDQLDSQRPCPDDPVEVWTAYQAEHGERP